MFPKYFYKVIYLFSIIIILLMLLSVAFYTLMERKIMSINQFRVGPNKIIMLGIVQPVFDGFKLFLKEINSMKKSPFLFYISPMISFIISIIFWSFFFMKMLIFMNMLFLFLLGITVYSFVFAGWTSFSKFGYLGGVRASVQTVSYEIGLTILIILIIFFFNNFSFLKTYEYIFIIFIPLFLSWMLILISETNRAPFDFAEGESELISGFNIEYGSSGFVLFFLSEYSMMIFFSSITCLFFNFHMMIFPILLFFFILMRTSFPRYRYDKLQKLMWFKFLPFLSSIFIIMVFFYKGKQTSNLYSMIPLL